jgi:hypothetical protein
VRWPFSRPRQAAPPVQPLPERPDRDWASLPPIARAAGDLEPVAGSREFAAGLPGVTGLETVLRPLGHARTPDAPPGLVTGVAAQRAAGPDALVPWRRRPAAAWPGTAAAAGVAEAPEAEPAAPEPAEPAP